ncbi:MAG: hypothetical protein ACI94Y_000230 [Maribacter sp.]|jgi:hypothetical protein
MDISKKQYMVEHFKRNIKNYSFMFEQWERDTLGELFPLFEKLSED